MKFIMTMMLYGFLSFNFANAISKIEVGSSPDSNYGMLLSTINSSSKTLDINIYELTSEDIVNAIASKMYSGVKVRLLLEGQPVGGFPLKGKFLLKKLDDISKITGNGEFHIFKAPKIAQRRFRYDHAKYTIADSKILEIGSENYANSGHPKDVNSGNRGWEVKIFDEFVVKDFSEKFESDFETNGKYDDIVTQEESLYSSFLPKEGDIEPNSSHKNNNYQNQVPSKILDDCDVETIFSPTTSKSGIINLIKNAKSEIKIETMTFDYWWKYSKTNVVESPIFTELKAAAERGVKVTVIMNDPAAFAGGKDIVANDDGGDDSSDSADNYKNSNYDTKKRFDELKKQGLPIKAYISDNKKMGVNYIHNKGMIVDGDKTLISSINWGRNSIENNREAAVILKCNSAANFYENLFQKDLTSFIKSF